MNTSWLRTPATRLIASAGSWFLFVLCFTLLFQASLVVIALGGSCASGGPYVIEVECPPNVAIYAPLSIFGGFIAVAISFAAGGFGAPLGVWAWAILFVGLSVAFAFGGSWLIFGMFAIMGAVPLVLELRANVPRTFIGYRTITGEALAFRDNTRRSIMSTGAPREGEVVPHAGHALLGIGVPAVGATLGVLAGLAMF